MLHQVCIWPPQPVPLKALSSGLSFSPSILAPRAAGGIDVEKFKFGQFVVTHCLTSALLSATEIFEENGVGACVCVRFFSRPN